MKKSVLFAAALLITFSVKAQEFNFGVKGGINVAAIGGNAYVGLRGFGSKISFHLGGIAEIPLAEKISLQPELLYSSQGTRWDFGTSGNSLKLDYINLPVLGKYHILKGLSAEAGPLFGFLISTNGQHQDRFKKFDIAFAIGASYKLNDNVFFGLRYNKGIANINDDGFDGGSSRNNVFQISAGYAF